MSEQQRLERLLEDELGQCCAGDVDRRLAELDTLVDDAMPVTAESDRAVFAALADETRYRLARLLVAADDELCVCELYPLVDVSESAVSHALADLVDAGLAQKRKEGRWRYYDATDRAETLLATIDTTHD